VLEMSNNNKNTQQEQQQSFYGPFIQDYPGEPVPEETLTHPPS